MKYNIISFLLLVLIFPLAAQAQQLLTLRNAIDTALSNNFEIQIARNNVDIDRINNTFGNAGGLPYISATAGDNGSITTVNQKFSDGTESNISNKSENALNAGIAGGIVLFNGFRIIATKERLNRLQNQSEIQLNEQIQTIIANIMVTYFDIIRQQNYLKIIQNSLDVSRQKLEIINVRNSVGMADAVIMLQAQSDVNSAQQLLESQKLIIEQGKSDLLLQMNAKKQTSFSVTDTIIVDRAIQMDSINNFLNRNLQILIAEQQILINEQIVNEISALRYPSVKLNASYDFYQLNADKGSLQMNRNYGPAAGVTLQVPIFNGNIYKTQKDVAKIRVDNSKLEKENLSFLLSTQATKLYRTYSTTLQQIDAQQENFEMTKKLVDIVMRKFQVSQATILDVKAAQTSYENAAYLLVNLQYSAKLAEIELKKIMYNLQY